jgi:DNA repair protein RadC
MTHKYVRELRISYLPRGDLSLEGRLLKTPAEAAQFLMPLLQNEPVEVSIVLCLTTKHRFLAFHEVARGSLDACVVHPREVFKAAILANAAAVIFAHNHPSGDPEPSPDDIQLTQRLVAAGALLGIDVLDSIVIGHNNSYHSFRERRQL